MLLLFLTGCTTMSDYRQGCYDGLDELYKVDGYNDPKYSSFLEFRKITICTDISQKRARRINLEHGR